MTEESAQIIKGTSVALPTLAGGVYLLYAQTIIGMLGILAGAVLSIVLTIKAIVDIRTKRRMEKVQMADIKYRQEHDLPCRRCTDKEADHA